MLLLQEKSSLPENAFYHLIAERFAKAAKETGCSFKQFGKAWIRHVVAYNKYWRNHHGVIYL